MTLTVPPTASLAEATRSAQASGRAGGSDRTVDNGVQPTAAGPAVVNHVRNAGSAADSDKTSAKSSQDKAKEKQTQELAKRDSDVRAHEQAHAAAGGQFAGAPSYTFQRGPDGRNYAVGGEVPIDVSPISGDPDATIQKMQQVKRAALAPIDPSDADRSIASHADAQIAEAQRQKLSGDNDSKSDSRAEVGAAARDTFGAIARRSGAAGYAAASGAGQA